MNKIDEIKKFLDMLDRDDVNDLIEFLIKSNKIKCEDILYYLSHEIDIFGN